MLLMMDESTGIEIIWKNKHLSGGFQRKNYLFLIFVLYKHLEKTSSIVTDRNKILPIAFKIIILII